MLVIANHADLGDGGECLERGDILAEGDLTGFVDDDGLDGDEAREAGGHQTVGSKHTQCAQDDPGA